MLKVCCYYDEKSLPRSRRQTTRLVALGCVSWFFAGSTIVTLLIVGRDLKSITCDNDDDVTLETYQGLVHKRRPQSHEYDDDVKQGLSTDSGLLGQREVTHPDQIFGFGTRIQVNAVIENKIFWSQYAESLVPTGLTDKQLHQFMKKIRRTRVKKIESAKWNKCGRPKNKHVTLEDGTVLCARYRHPANTLLQGELLTFHLSRLLRLDNVPATMLSFTASGAYPWRGYNLTQADWQYNHTVSLTQWIHDLDHYRSRAHIPLVLLAAYDSGQALRNVRDVTEDELSTLVQWTDLILFDYITGHYDRVASMQDGARQDSNPDVMRHSVRNLRRQWKTGKMWLIDNESGLLDAYMLLYGNNNAVSHFHEFHRRMLQSICLFRRQTVDRLQWLSEQKSPSRLLESLAVATDSDRLYLKLGSTTELDLFHEFFHVRLKEIVEWIRKCQEIN